MSEKKQYWKMNPQEHLNFLKRETHIKTFIPESCVVVSSVYTYDAGFESMVFPAKENGEVLNYLECECKRYDSFKEMQNGHKQLCKKWKKKGGKKMKDEEKARKYFEDSKDYYDSREPITDRQLRQIYLDGLTEGRKESCEVCEKEGIKEYQKLFDKQRKIIEKLFEKEQDEECLNKVKARYRNKVLGGEE